ncbi:hypothetical protein [Rhodococcus tukisamuensis]|uniref:Uncharacterized protein n=1 Tax=Rhodococcus tukisamuensis TaxID=168276 RepID=A0A1G6TAT6_9NOCA|nr:hypothetical protein [Rhodococcus tukisamuensis]SDD25666.1 hypothetical protein SAMN05444580_103444 [Rhodococcus tukisamuensis]
MALPIPSGRRTGAFLALAAATVLIGSAPAGAEPATPSIPRGSLVIVNDVLGPEDPGFWNPDVPGTRVLTPVEPGVEVLCASGFEPTPGCSTLDMRDWSSPQRDLVFVDVPVIGRPPLRVWMDIIPRLDEGPLGHLMERLFAR